MIDYPPLDTSAPIFPSEADLVHLMCRHIPYIEQYWVNEDEEHGYFGTLDVNEFQPPGGPINEMIIRSLGDELRGYAALHQSAFFDPTLAGIEKPVLLDRLNRCLRWICAHHLSGPRRTEPFEWNGQWGDDWESSLWIAGHRNGSQPRCKRTGAGRTRSRASRTRLRSGPIPRGRSPRRPLARHKGGGKCVGQLSSRLGALSPPRPSLTRTNGCIEASYSPSTPSPQTSIGSIRGSSTVAR